MTRKQRLLRKLTTGSKKSGSPMFRPFLKRLVFDINVFYSEQDGGYIADIPDLKYCSAFGATPEEALNEVLKAKAAWLEAAREAGKPIPRPRYRPVIYQTA